MCTLLEEQTQGDRDSRIGQEVFTWRLLMVGYSLSPYVTIYFLFGTIDRVFFNNIFAGLLPFIDYPVREPFLFYFSSLPELIYLISIVLPHFLPGLNFNYFTPIFLVFFLLGLN